MALGTDFESSGDGRLRYLLNPRFILSCSDALWTGIQELSSQRGWPVHTHALEQEEETVTVQALKEAETRSAISMTMEFSAPICESPMGCG